MVLFRCLLDWVCFGFLPDEVWLSLLRYRLHIYDDNHCFKACKCFLVRLFDSMRDFCPWNYRITIVYFVGKNIYKLKQIGGRFEHVWQLVRSAHNCENIHGEFRVDVVNVYELRPMQSWIWKKLSILIAVENSDFYSGCAVVWRRLWAVMMGNGLGDHVDESAVSVTNLVFQILLKSGLFLELQEQSEGTNGLVATTGKCLTGSHSFSKFQFSTVP